MCNNYDLGGFGTWLNWYIIPNTCWFCSSLKTYKIIIFRLPNGRVAETFHKTPIMSTYLIAFIVSHYIKVSTDTSNPARPFDIYARDNARQTGDWSLDVGVRLLAAMEEFTGIPYYNMQDHIDMKQAAIPDFSAGAMENWGLLTYRSV